MATPISSASVIEHRMPNRAPFFESPGLGVADPAAAQNPFAEDAAENPHAEDHDRRHRDVAAQRSGDRHGDGHRDRLGGYGVENLPLGAERHGDIDDAQHPDDASRERGHAHGKQASAQAFQLFVEQIPERHDRHAEGEIEDARGVAVTLVADSGAAQEDDHGDERQQHGMQQRQPRTAVDHPSEAVKPHGEGQQKEVRGEK